MNVCGDIPQLHSVLNNNSNGSNDRQNFTLHGLVSPSKRIHDPCHAFLKMKNVDKLIKLYIAFKEIFLKLFDYREYF